MSRKKIAILGGGASGIFAAISAGLASQGKDDFEITIFEKNKSIGKPILRSGNGRCNLSNTKIVRDEALELLKGRGLLVDIKDTGEIFPYSNKAQTVLDLCLEILDECNVNIVCDHEISDISQLNDFDAKIICTGHDTSANLLPKEVNFFDFEPVLCPIEVNEPIPHSLENLRAKALVTVKDSLGVVIFEEFGEVQFRSYGLSGIVVFNASRYARACDTIELNFKPKDMGGSEYEKLVQSRFNNCGNYEGLVAKELSDYLIEKRSDPTSLQFTIARLHDDKKLVQVYRGGVDKRDAFNFEEMTFICGEALDYDGPCGGFNISHAFNSGLRAGKLCIEYFQALKGLKQGRAVGIPTDTVYGVAISVEHAPSPSIINQIKKSPDNKPIAWLINDVEDLSKYAKNVREYVYDLIDEGWPGGLTLILEASDKVREHFASETGTIALRMPKSQLVLSLIKELGCPLAASSANFSGQDAVQTFSEVDEALIERFFCSIKSYTDVSSGIASTIIDCTGDTPKVLR